MAAAVKFVGLGTVVVVVVLVEVVVDVEVALVCRALAAVVGGVVCGEPEREPAIASPVTKMMTTTAAAIGTPSRRGRLFPRVLLLSRRGGA
jgi:hypothetical protein